MGRGVGLGVRAAAGRCGARVMGVRRHRDVSHGRRMMLMLGLLLRGQ